MHKHVVDCYVKDAEVIGAVVVSYLADDGVGEPVPDQLSMPSSRLVETSVIAILNVDNDNGTSALGTA